MEHFQIAPVAAARSCLLSALASSETSGCKPLYLRTRSRVCLSSAHYKENEKFKIYNKFFTVYIFLGEKEVLENCIQTVCVNTVRKSEKEVP